MSFGQRFTITPLQMITAACAIANNGKLVKPRIVTKIEKYINFLKDNEEFETKFYDVGDGLSVSVKKTS